MQDIGLRVGVEGEAEFKRSLSGIKQETKELASEMKVATSGFGDNRKAMEVLGRQIQTQQKLVDTLNGKLKSQQNVLEGLASELDAARKQYGDNSTEVAALTKRYDSQVTAISRTRTEINNATAALNNMKKARVDEYLGKLKSGFDKAAKATASVVSGAKTLVSSLTQYASKTAATLDTIDKQSQRIGVSTDAFQELDYVLGLAGADVSIMQSGVKSLTGEMQRAASGNKKASATFDSLGISVTNADGSLRSQEEVMWETLDALQRVGNETERAALANELFGRSGVDLMPLLNAEAGSIAETREQAHELGLVMTEEVVKDGAALNDSLTQTRAAFGAITTELGAALMPIALELSEWVKQLMPLVREVIATLQPAVSKLFEILLPPLKSLISAVLPPIIKLVRGVIDVVGLVLDKVSSVIPKVVGFFENLRDKIKGIVDSIRGFFSGFRIEIPKIKLPHFSISPRNWNLSNLLSGVIPRLSIDWYDKGGVFNRPAVIGVGEKRPEFVGALDDLREIVRDETGSRAVTLNIYGARGQDVEALADIVMDRMQSATDRRRAAYGY